MQIVIGLTLLFGIILFSAFFSVLETANIKRQRSTISVVTYFMGMIVVLYLCVAMLGSIVSTVAWLGLFSPEYAMWAAEAIISPLLWLIGS